MIHWVLADSFVPCAGENIFHKLVNTYKLPFVWNFIVFFAVFA